MGWTDKWVTNDGSCKNEWACGRANIGTVVRVGRAGYAVNDVGNSRYT